MTPEQRKAYLDASGTFCPFCNSTNLAGYKLEDHDKGKLEQQVYCKSCPESWTDIYTLTDIIPLEDEEESQS